MNEAKEVKMMSIRGIAKTGLLSEYSLRAMQRDGRLPSVTVGTGGKVLINYNKLVELLTNGEL